jgi:NAD(P)-dependent dehydrogenase (short-subunit alcohol dehydrogenase family)
MNNPFSLEGKTILVTGASSGIGQQVAIRLSQDGAKVIIVGRNAERLAETFSKLNGNGHASFQADITDEKVVKEGVASLGNIQGVVHAAGITSHMPAQLIGKKQLDEVFKINFEAPVLLTRFLLSQKKLVDGASLVFISTIATLHPYYGGGLYTSSKKALEGYCTTLALELASRKMRANCISPAMVQTPMLEKVSQTLSSETMEGMRAMHPLGFGTADDVANAILFLLSDASKWITGANILLGGF